MMTTTRGTARSQNWGYRRVVDFSCFCFIGLFTARWTIDCWFHELMAPV